MDCKDSTTRFEGRRRAPSPIHPAQRFATLRDTQLPRLISGQLRLPEVGAAVEAAL
jgi:type I restriction enzyme S subunit